MTFRSLAAPVALAALLASLWGCAGKSTSTELTGQDALATGNAAFAQNDYSRACQDRSDAMNKLRNIIVKSRNLIE